MKTTGLLVIWFSMLLCNSCDGQGLQREFNNQRVLELRQIEYDGAQRVFAGQFLSQLQNPAFVSFIELSIEQRDEILKLHRDFHRDGAITVRECRTNDLAKTWSRLVREQDDEIIKQVILPHQVEAAKRFAAFRKIMNEGLAMSLVGGSLAKQFGLTYQQRKDLNARADEIEQDLIEKMHKARREAIEKLINSLPEENVRDAMQIAQPFLTDDGKILHWSPTILFRRPKEVPREIPIFRFGTG